MIKMYLLQCILLACCRKLPLIVVKADEKVILVLPLGSLNQVIDYWEHQLLSYNFRILINKGMYMYVGGSR